LLFFEFLFHFIHVLFCLIFVLFKLFTLDVKLAGDNFFGLHLDKFLFKLGVILSYLKELEISFIEILFQGISLFLQLLS